MNPDSKQRLITRLREILELPSVSDHEILKLTEGSFLRARVELGMALSDFKNALKRAFRIGGDG